MSPSLVSAASLSASSSGVSDSEGSPEDSTSSVDSDGGTSPLYSKSAGSSSSRSGANLPVSWPSSIRSEPMKCWRRGRRKLSDELGMRNKQSDQRGNRSIQHAVSASG